MAPSRRSSQTSNNAVGLGLNVPNSNPSTSPLPSPLLRTSSPLAKNAPIGPPPGEEGYFPPVPNTNGSGNNTNNNSVSMRKRTPSMNSISEDNTSDLKKLAQIQATGGTARPGTGTTSRSISPIPEGKEVPPHAQRKKQVSSDLSSDEHAEGDPDAGLSVVTGNGNGTGNGLGITGIGLGSPTGKTRPRARGGHNKKQQSVAKLGRRKLSISTSSLSASGTDEEDQGQTPKLPSSAVGEESDLVMSPTTISGSLPPTPGTPHPPGQPKTPRRKHSRSASRSNSFADSGGVGGGLNNSTKRPKTPRTPSSHQLPFASPGLGNRGLPSPGAGLALTLGPPPPGSPDPTGAKALTEVTSRLEDGKIGEKEAESVRRTISRVQNFPMGMPLECGWTLFFSDTSSTSKRSNTGGKDAYSSHIVQLFTAQDVPTLCGCLKALSTVMPKGRRGTGSAKDLQPGPYPEEAWGLGLARMRPGQNYHFFREGVEPIWEDPNNATGGRLTISPSPALLDVLFMRILLLLAGSSLSHATSMLASDPDYNPPPPPTPGSTRHGKPPTIGTGEGRVLGLVASRRLRGDRVEVWIGGRVKGEPPNLEWVERLKESLAREGLTEMRTVKYKKHLSGGGGGG